MSVYDLFSQSQLAASQLGEMVSVYVCVRDLLCQFRLSTELSLLTHKSPAYYEHATDLTEGLKLRKLVSGHYSAVSGNVCCSVSLSL